MSVAATVRTWYADEGWGVLDSDATPGGCWTHFSALDLDGDRSLSPGDEVQLVAESPGQDGLALARRPRRRRRARTGDDTRTRTVRTPPRW